MKNMGYLLIILGLAAIGVGLRIVLKKEEPSRPIPTAAKQEKVEFQENKAKGDAFEAFVVKSFSPKYFTLLEWRSDKYVEGRYAVSNHFPDLEVQFELHSKGIKDVFAIECKWRQNYYKGGVEWAQNYQVEKYKEYAQKSGVPVFVVIGIAGTPDQPNELYIVPLTSLTSNTISKDTLSQYKKEKGMFYWDTEEKALR